MLWCFETAALDPRGCLQSGVTEAYLHPRAGNTWHESRGAETFEDIWAARAWKRLWWLKGTAGGPSIITFGHFRLIYLFHNLNGSTSCSSPSFSFLSFSCRHLPLFPPPPPCFKSFLFPSMQSVCVCLINTSLCLPAAVSDRNSRAASCCSFGAVYSSPSICPSRRSQAFVLFSAAINLLANRQQSHRLASGFWLYCLLRMPEPQTNPPLWGDPQTKNGSFCTFPQIPHLFRMKTKINLMTCIQCGQTGLSFFPSPWLVFS